MNFVKKVKCVLNWCCEFKSCFSLLQIHWVIYENLCPLFFYQSFIFSPNDSPSKTIKNVFDFIEKGLFVLEIFKFLLYFLFLSTLSRCIGTNGSVIIYVSWIGLNKFADVIFGITQKLLYINKFGQIMHK